MRAVVFLADGFEECEALIVVDIFRRAKIETIMASVMEGLAVESSRHIVVRADAIAEDLDYEGVDLIFLPGGRLGTDNLDKCELVKEKCREFAVNKMIAAICAAPSILAGIELLEEKDATCHPDYEDKMCCAVLTHESVSVAGNIITGQGLGATFDFAFKLVELLMGNEIVEQIKTSICYKG